MKQALTFLLGFLFLHTITLLQSQNLVLDPSNFISGDKVFVSYNPIGTALEMVEKKEAVCYEISDEGLKATEIYLHRKNQAYTGAFIVSKETKVVFISFTGDDKSDNNHDEGFRYFIYQKDRKTPKQGAFYLMSQAFSKYYKSIGISRDYQKAMAYLEKEFSTNPELKKEGKYLVDYSFYGAKTKNEAVIEDCKTLAKSIKLIAENEQNLLDLSSILSNIGEKEAAQQMEGKILKAYPDGKLAQKNMLTSFFRAQTFEDKLEIYNTLIKKYNDSETVKESLDRIYGTIAEQYSKNEDWENCELYFSKIENPVSKASYLNRIAWRLSGESLNAKPNLAGKGMNMSKQSLDLIKTELENGISKPQNRTKNQWKKRMEYTYGMYADTYALCAYHDGQPKESLDYQLIACNSNDFSNGEMNERYCKLLEEVKGVEVAEYELQKLISRGVATEKMKADYQRLYLQNNTLESAFEKNAVFLQSLANEKKKSELKAKMINDKAPDFSLVNLAGEKISLSDFRGKVVVLDFWATWCGPCKASFPGMQAALEKYQEDDVVFLFLNTWERAENKEDNAQKFIEENKYTFNVLMDNENEIVSKYKVGGIPTKFIVDKKGNIRFKSIGFSGNTDELVNELSMMIDMVNEAGTRK